MEQITDSNNSNNKNFKIICQLQIFKIKRLREVQLKKQKL